MKYNLISCKIYVKISLITLTFKQMFIFRHIIFSNSRSGVAFDLDAGSPSPL